jgi:hypothetical protein
MHSETLYEEFIVIAQTMNKNLEIVPVLYGSLGLEKVTNVQFNPQDIDILVPVVFLQEQWPVLKDSMEQIGYTLVNLHEHEFIKEDVKIGIAFIEDLDPFAGVDFRSLTEVEDQGVRYYLLSASDYLKVYEKSSTDGYRRSKNNNKDFSKIELLIEMVRK